MEPAHFPVFSPPAVPCGRHEDFPRKQPAAAVSALSAAAVGVDGNARALHLLGSCRSAGLSGGKQRDGSAAYYLLGKDTRPTGPDSVDFFTEGKVLGGFIMAATEWERRGKK